VRAGAGGPLMEGRGDPGRHPGAGGVGDAAALGLGAPGVGVRVPRRHDPVPADGPRHICPGAVGMSRQIPDNSGGQLSLSLLVAPTT